MGACSCLGAARGALICISIGLVVLGSILLPIGLWMLLDGEGLAVLLGQPVLALQPCSYVCCAMGALSAAMGALGGLGALRGARAPLGVFAVLLLLLLLAQVVLGAMAYTQRSALWSHVGSQALQLIRGYPTARGAVSAPQRGWDALQQQLSCCGWFSPQDWAPPPACSCLPPHSRPTAPTPLPHGRCPTATPGDTYGRGCAHSAHLWVRENLVAIVGGSVGIGLAELCLLLLASFVLRGLGP